jgi:hypothetical protein
MEKGAFIIDMPRRRQSRRSRKSRRSTKRRSRRTQHGGFGEMKGKEVVQYFNKEGAAIMGEDPETY